MFEDEYKTTKVYIFNSCSASVGETQIAYRVRELAESGATFEEIVEKVEAFIKSINT